MLHAVDSTERAVLHYRFQLNLVSLNSMVVIIQAIPLENGQGHNKKVIVIKKCKINLVGGFQNVKIVIWGNVIPTQLLVN